MFSRCWATRRHLPHLWLLDTSAPDMRQKLPVHYWALAHWNFVLILWLRRSRPQEILQQEFSKQSSKSFSSREKSGRSHLTGVLWDQPRSFVHFELCCLSLRYIVRCRGGLQNQTRRLQTRTQTSSARDSGAEQRSESGRSVNKIQTLSSVRCCGGTRSTL